MYGAVVSLQEGSLPLLRNSERNCVKPLPQESFFNNISGASK
jgi:hypothetical protein